MKVYIVAITFMKDGDNPTTLIDGVFNSRNKGLEKLVETYKHEVEEVEKDYSDEEMATFEEVDTSNEEGDEEISMSFKTKNIFVTVSLIPESMYYC